LCANITQDKAKEMLDLSAFDENFKSSLEDLSVALSLGHKYGAPKMKVTIRLREEFAASQAAQALLEEYFATMQNLCRPSSALQATSNTAKPTSAVGTTKKDKTMTSTVNFGRTAPPPPPPEKFVSRATKLLVVLDDLRRGLYKRGAYLQCITRALPQPPRVPLTDPPLTKAARFLLEHTSASALAVASAAAAAAGSDGSTPAADASVATTDENKTDSLPVLLSAAAYTVAALKADTTPAPGLVASPPPNATPQQTISATVAANLAVVPFLNFCMSVTATGRVEMGALFKKYWEENGDRLRGLGRTQVELPPAFVERMTSEEERSKQNHFNYMGTYRHLVETLHENWHPVPKVACTDILHRWQAAASREMSGLKQMFTAAYNASQEERNQNQRLLKPSLGAPDSRPALDALCAKEAERSMKARQAIISYRQQCLECCKENADLFTRELLYTSVTMMTLLDTTVALCDLYTPGHEGASKRRGLKRAMRQQTRLTRLGAGGLEEDTAADAPPPPSVIPNGDRFLQKTWPGVPLAGLQLPATLPSLVLDPSSADVAAAADPAAAAAGGAGGEGQAQTVQAMTGYKFLANREVIAQRDQVYGVVMIDPVPAFTD
jgi:hypothetical protein